MYEFFIGRIGVSMKEGINGRDGCHLNATAIQSGNELFGCVVAQGAKGEVADVGIDVYEHGLRSFFGC